MGLLKKDRRGTKPAIPAPGVWATRIGDAAEAAEDAQEATLMDALRGPAGELATQTDLVWPEQSKRIKAMAMALAGLQRLSAVSLSALAYLRAVMVPFAVEAYFLAEDAAVRRQAIPLLKALFGLDPSCVDHMLQSHLLTYIGARSSHPELDLSVVDTEVEATYRQQTAGQRAQALEILAQVPQVGSPVLRRFVSDVLAFSADALESAQAQLGSQLGSAELIALRDEYVHVMRLVFLGVTKLADGETLREAIVASMRKPAPEFVDATLRRVYQLCWGLVGSSDAALNSRQVAAMVLVQMIERAGGSRQTRAAGLATQLLGIQVETSLELPAYLDDAGGREQCMDDAVAMICIARGVVSLAPYETTLQTLAADAPSGNVHEAVFTHIASVCGRSQLAPGVKVVVFESMATWLQETARLLQRCVADTTGALSEAAFGLGQRVLELQHERIMGYVWSYWDDPLDAVQMRVKAIFEAFLDIGAAMSQAPVQGTAANENSSFMNDVLELVLAMDWSRRVKYALLGVLCTRIDLNAFFKRAPDVLSNCLETMAQPTMASRASTLLLALGERTAETISQDAASELELLAEWVPAISESLCRDDDTIRRSLAQQLLPRLFEDVPSMVREILRELTASDSSRDAGTCRQHALIVVLKVARAQNIVTLDEVAALDARVVDMLEQAIYHPDWHVRADMLGLLCEARKLSIPPSPMELDLLLRLLRVSANAPSADFRQQQHASLITLASRLVTSAAHANRIIETGKPPVPSQRVRHRERDRRQQALAEGLANGETEAQVLRKLGVLSQEEQLAQAHDTLCRVRAAVDAWLDLAVRGCLYPGAGFAKVAMGLRWLDILAAHFTVGRTPPSPDSAVAPFAVRGLCAPDFAQAADSQGAVSADEVVTVLTQVLIDDPFDANRASAFDLLTAWPLEPSDAARQWANRLLRRALHLVRSTRAGESESGALIVRWLFRKFVQQEAMRIDLAEAPKDTEQYEDVSLGFAFGLLRLIQSCRQAAERNLLDAAQRYPLHGLLTAAQYVATELNYTGGHTEDWRRWLAVLAHEAMAVSKVVLGVLTSASPEGNVPASVREMEAAIDGIIRSVDTVAIDHDEPVATATSDIDAGGSGDDDDGDDDDDDLLEGSAGPRHQVILSYCWRAVKEVSALLSMVATVPTGSDQDDTNWLVTASLVADIGGLLHMLLTSIRHRGAFSAVYPAFMLVCGRLFGSSDPELNQRVAGWLDQCLDATTIRRVSVTRRSAGWPFCLLATLTCDKLATQSLLPRAMDRILVLVGDLQIDELAEDSTTDLPQVHAINMLRALLDDHQLASDIVPYVEQGYVLALTGLRSKNWAIRNVCSLLFAALTRRVFGNSRARHETRFDGITGRELFTRFPGLHPFLTNQLEAAVDRLAEADLVEQAPPKVGQGPIDPVTAVLRSGARFIHPALYPCLILLARLQPSLADTTADRPAGEVVTGAATGAVAPPMDLDKEVVTRVNERNSTVHVTSMSIMLSMYSFTELVELCVDSPVFKTREMAARAFAPLIPSERAAQTVVSLLNGIQEAGDRMASNTCHGALCQVHELLRVHWLLGRTPESMRRSFITHVLPALTALWPVLICKANGHSSDDADADADAYDVADIVRLKYLSILNDFVARGESWLLPGLDDRALERTVRLLLSRFRITLLYGSLHPLLSGSVMDGFEQTPGAYGAVCELMRLFLACADDRTMAVVRADGSVQLQIDGDFLDEHGACMPNTGDPADSSEVLYNPWPVLSNALEHDAFYETKLVVLEWMLDHVDQARMEVFERVGIENLLAALIKDTLPSGSKDPLVRSAVVRLLARLCTRLEIHASMLPGGEDGLLAYWDELTAQLRAKFCPLSVATALVEFQAALVHMLLQSAGAGLVDGVNRRAFAWAQQLYEWTHVERAVPYRRAVSRALVVYSGIKRYNEAASRQYKLVDPPSEEMMRLCYWRLLQDDDEDVREYMAQSISRRLGRELASDQVCEKLVADFVPPRGAPFPRAYVENRLLGYLLGPVGPERAVRDALVPGRVLFEHENPNIYIDEPRNEQLAYYSLVQIASVFEDDDETMRVCANLATQCVDALDVARRVLIESKEAALNNGVVLSGSLGATSVSALFALLQAWILGARLNVFAASRVGDASMVHRVREITADWLESAELQPVHPWINRALRSLRDTATAALAGGDGGLCPVPKESAMADLFLLTYV
ncbi:hypothetical protein GGF46_003255 [Coemansia sp. RSA 552]|nr:hypothetical protein GGF46_003255 [Coemansia sp. RSA 552]